MHTEFDSKVSLEMSVLKTGDKNNKLDLIKKKTNERKVDETGSGI